MSAIAIVLRAMGHVVSGSDLRTRPWRSASVPRASRVSIGHRAENVGDADAVDLFARRTAENVELVEAKAAGLLSFPARRMLAAICATRRCLAVAGTHGKTTTASMLSLILVEAGLRPSFVIGADVNEIGTNAVWDTGDWLVVEADESFGTFRAIRPDVAVLTNVEPDHLDYYGTFDELRTAFSEFVGAATEGAVVCADDPRLRPSATSAGRHHDRHGGRGHLPDDRPRVGPELGRPSPARTRGHAGHAGHGRARSAQRPQRRGGRGGRARRPGAPFEQPRPRWPVRRGDPALRVPWRGRGVTFVDDYAHLPTEVRAALATARTGGWSRVVAVFQPHRFSRTAALATEFGTAFADADVLIVTDVYSAGEPPVPGRIGPAGRRRRPLVGSPAARLLRPGLGAAAASPWPRLLQAGDLCLTLGAGDLTSLPDVLLDSPSW